MPTREWSPLATHSQINITDSSVRTRAVRGIGHHHTASPSKLGSLSQFLPGGREVTANYFIWRNEIWRIVPENRRAFTTASATYDGGSITYEICNSGGDPNWPFDPETLDTVARLDAEIAGFYGIPLVHAFPGFWEHKDVYPWTDGDESYITACAGPSFYINLRIAAAATAGLPAKPLEPKDNDMHLINSPSWRNAHKDVLITPNGAQEVTWDYGIAATLRRSVGNPVELAYDHDLLAQVNLAWKIAGDSRAIGVQQTIDTLSANVAHWSEIETQKILDAIAAERASGVPQD